MKKLLVLLLVLGMTSAASALSLSLTPDSSVPSAVVEGDLDQDLYVVLVSDAAMTISLGADAPDLSGYSGDAVDVTGFFPTNSPAGMAYGGDYWVLATSDSANYPILGGEFLTLAGGEGAWVYACWFDEVNFTPTEIGEVQLVPEPMTVALLGLGGLLMLRRRK